MRNVRKLFNNFSRIKQDSVSSTDPSLSFSIKWCEHLLAILRKHRDDQEFVADVFLSAHKYFMESLTDQEKADVFSYLLGKNIRRW